MSQLPEKQESSRLNPAKNDKNSAFAGIQNLWERVFNTVPGLIMILDTEHRVIQANKAMADRLSCQPENIIGLHCFEVVHGLEMPAAYCPHTQLLKDGQEHKAEAFEKNLKGTFDISVSPLFDGEKRLIGSIHIARDISKRAKTEKALRELNEEFKHKIEELTADLKKNNRHLKARLLFEELLVEISSVFINLPLNKVDTEIQNQIERLGKFLGVDRCILGVSPEEETAPPYLYGWARVGIYPLPVTNPLKSWPWLTSRLRQGKVTKFSRLEDLPEAAKTDRESWDREGSKSGMSIPLQAKGKVVGAISFAMMRTQHQWPPELIKRVQLIGNIFGNVLLRQQIDQKLHDALEEIRQLKNRVEAERIVLEEEIKLEHDFDEIVGNSPAIKYVLKRVEQVAPMPTAVLVLGETGTGKELVARAIHARSPRNYRPLFKVNCATLPANLIESELFGHEKNAFTGAGARKLGRFEVADGGTLFLDEIGELPLDLQPKLLRVLQDGEFERLGSNQTLKVDVRVIAATNRDLELEIANSRFRQDLWYRLNVFPITIPPLRSRSKDIPLLVNHFVKYFSKHLGKEVHSIPKKIMENLRRYDWPGNIRELENIIERAMVITQGNTLQLADTLTPAAGTPSDSLKTLDDLQRDYILEILDKTGWKIEGKNGAATLLGLNPGTLRGRMRKFGIKRS